MDIGPNTSNMFSRYNMNRRLKRPYLAELHNRSIYRPSEDNYRYNLSKGLSTQSYAVHPPAGHKKPNSRGLEPVDTSKCGDPSIRRIPPKEEAANNLGTIRKTTLDEKLEKNGLSVILDPKRSLSNLITVPTMKTGFGSNADFFKISAQVNLVDELREFQSTLITECYRLCKVSQNSKPQQELQAEYQIDDEMNENLVLLTPIKMLKMCLKSQENSMIIQSFLEKAHPAKMERVVNLFIQEVGQLIHHKYGNFVASWLVVKNDGFMKACEVFCILNLSRLVGNKCAVKVMQALAGVSKAFCKAFNQYFKHHYSNLQKSKQASIIMNAVILNIEDESSIHYLIEGAIKKLPGCAEGQRTEILRILSSLLQRVDVNKLHHVVTGTIQQVQWLTEDKIGNYSVQMLFSKKFKEYHPQLIDKLLNDNPLHFFTNRYRQIVVLRYLDSYIAKVGNFHEKLVENLLKQNKFDGILKSLTSNNSGFYLLLCVLSKCGSPKTPIWCRSLLEMMQHVLTNLKVTEIDESANCYHYFRKLRSLTVLKDQIQDLQLSSIVQKGTSDKIQM